MMRRAINLKQGVGWGVSCLMMQRWGLGAAMHLVQAGAWQRCSCQDIPAVALEGLYGGACIVTWCLG